MAARIPELSSLHNRKVAVTGLGGVGWASAIELARNGVGQLRILDYDFVEPGTTVRWALGLSSAGRQKTAALADFIRNNYPYTTVITHNHRIGNTFNEYAAKRSSLDKPGNSIPNADGGGTSFPEGNRRRVYRLLD